MPAGGSRPLHQKEKSVLPKEVEHWSLTTLRVKLVKIGAKVGRHGRYVTFKLAEVAAPKELFRKILRLVDDPRPRQNASSNPPAEPRKNHSTVDVFTQPGST